MDIFGWTITKKRKAEEEIASFSPKDHDDGALIVAPGGSYGTYLDLDGAVRTETELITKYRDMAIHPEIDAAIEEIINASISMDDPSPVSLILDDLDTMGYKNADTLKEALQKEFREVLKLLEFKKLGYDIFRQWYIDGRLYYHVIIDDKNLSRGILEMRYIDPRKIRKVREVVQRNIVPDPRMSSVNAGIQQTKNEYYIYTEKGFNSQNRVNPSSIAGLKIAADAIVQVSSGLTDVNRTMILGHLHKAIKRLNQLRTVEDASVIYRLVRAPERRVWHVDVSGLPLMKADQYVRDTMARHKNRLVYDSATGDIKSDRKFMTMLEDFWLPKREGGRGTSVDTLSGGEHLGKMEDVLYFQKKLYESLNVPISRLDHESIFLGNQSSQITREELKFDKFVTRLRTRFSELFAETLERQVILKNIITYEEWVKIKDLIRFDYARDSHFSEVKDNEVLSGRIMTVQGLEPFIGRYYSQEWVRRNVLRQSDEEIKEIDMEIAREPSPPLEGEQPELPLISSPENDDEEENEDNEEQEPSKNVALRVFNRASR